MWPPPLTTLSSRQLRPPPPTTLSCLRELLHLPTTWPIEQYHPQTTSHPGTRYCLCVLEDSQKCWPPICLRGSPNSAEGEGVLSETDKSVGVFSVPVSFFFPTLLWLQRSNSGTTTVLFWPGKSSTGSNETSQEPGISWHDRILSLPQKNIYNLCFLQPVPVRGSISLESSLSSNLSLSQSLSLSSQTMQVVLMLIILTLIVIMTADYFFYWIGEFLCSESGPTSRTGRTRLYYQQVSFV